MLYQPPSRVHLWGHKEVKMKNIKRNPNRMKKVPRRTATNWMDAMTPQGQALYCAEFVDNAYNYQEKL